MKTREDEKWQNLLQHSGPTFAGAEEPPYGFITSTLARLRSEDRQVAEIERIGWRALLASLAVLIITVSVTLGTNHSDERTDLEPGVRGFVQMENIPVS